MSANLILEFLDGTKSEQQLRQAGVAPAAIRKAKAKKNKLASASSSARKVGGDLASSNDGIKDLLGTVSDATGGLNKFEQAFLNIGKAAVSNKDVFNTLATSINEVAKLIVVGADRVEKLRIQFNKLGTQDGRQLIRSLVAQQRQLERFGVTLQTLADTTDNFRNNLNVLVSDSFQAQERSLTRLAAVNTKFGISINQSTNLINSLDRGFDLSGKQADEFSRKLLKFAKDTGQPFSKVFEQFNSNVKDFFVELDPDKALRKFTVFQQIARRFGTEVGELTKLTDQFETLESGMEFGGNLNMLLSNLGGSFDAVQATLMDQPQRMEYIANQVSQVGDRIRGMSDLGQRAILRELAKTLGVDVGTIRAMVNRDKGEDLQRFLKGTSDLSAMTTGNQQKLADQMTSRAERTQITNDRLVNNFAIRAEEILQKATETRQRAERQLIDNLVIKNESAEKAFNLIADKAKEVSTDLNNALEKLRTDGVKTSGDLTVKVIPLTGNGDPAGDPVFGNFALQSPNDAANALTDAANKVVAIFNPKGTKRK